MTAFAKDKRFGLVRLKGNVASGRTEEVTVTIHGTHFHDFNIAAKFANKPSSYHSFA
jgi:hypothetical protein